MIYFLNSSPWFEDTDTFNHANFYGENLHKALPNKVINCVYIVSTPDDYENNELYSWWMERGFLNEGYEFSSYTILDRRNADKTKELIEKADLLILAGGHVPTENKFFCDISLRENLENFNGVIIGNSAGSMNQAESVYAMPELEGEAVDKSYKKFIRGLGITDKNIIPHYNDLKDEVLDGLRVIEEISVPDSFGHEFYVYPDGSYIMGINGKEKLCGEAFLIKEGKFTKINDNEEVLYLD